MAGGINPSQVFSMISGVGDAVIGGLQDEAKRREATQLGDLIAKGDLDAASAAALRGGNMELGLKLQELKLSRAAQQTVASGLGNLYTGGGSGGLAGGNAGGTGTGGQASTGGTSLPTFAQGACSARRSPARRAAAATTSSGRHIRGWGGPWASTRSWRPTSRRGRRRRSGAWSAPRSSSARPRSRRRSSPIASASSSRSTATSPTRRAPGTPGVPWPTRKTPRTASAPGRPTTSAVSWRACRRSGAAGMPSRTSRRRPRRQGPALAPQEPHRRHPCRPRLPYHRPASRALAGPLRPRTPHPRGHRPA
jgi:hypothetical protein